MTKDTEAKTLERVIIRMKDNSKTSVVGREFTSELTTTRPKLKKKKMVVETQVQQLVNLEMKL